MQHLTDCTMNLRTLSILLFCWVLLAHVPLSAQRSQPATIDECELRRSIIYPDEAEQRGVEGDVELRVKVNADGHARDVEISSASDRSLGTAAREGVLRAQFRPAAEAGESVSGTMTLKVRFVMAPVGEVEGEYDAVIRAGFGKLYVADTTKSFGGPQRAASTENETWPEWDEFVPVDMVPDFDIDYLYCLLIYPEIARRSGISGRVTIRLLVDAEGRPRKAIAERVSDKIFEEPATKALMNMRLSPAVMKGKPVPIWISIPIIFKTR